MMIIIACIFAKIGSKRIVGGINSFFLCLFFFPVGYYLVLKSRRLDDEFANESLLIKFNTPASEGPL